MFAAILDVGHSSRCKMSKPCDPFSGPKNEKRTSYVESFEPHDLPTVTKCCCGHALPFGSEELPDHRKLSYFDELTLDRMNFGQNSPTGTKTKQQAIKLQLAVKNEEDRQGTFQGA
ncbi:hypothetical protein PC116_g24631 [Phytophthora cactorum]|nr:hypothetical protein Pcac1_g19596 [Phytophthora cactorum]KAG2977756.1 hypothetical protein PC119_g21900 [Phytophthora cactorum]KAG3142950.1 hypothetical protein C6341_g19238 [Phytophthora cactorum]KAG4226969.1 hypothetical protein PC116_g24631 [Phytophthora cactorum]